MKYHTMKYLAKFVVFALFAKTEAEIIKDGLWTGNDWYKDNIKLGVVNGVPYSNDPDTKRRITSAVAVDGDASDYKSKENVKRVMRVLNEASWNKLFPLRNELYTYEGFLHAAGKFEAFCGENNL